LTSFLFQSSPGWIALCLLAGVGYAVALYQAHAPWSRPINWALAAVRAVVVGTLCFLLLNFLLRQVDTSVEKKTVVLAVDNSESVGTTGGKFLTGLQDLTGQLQAKGFDVEVQTLADDATPTLDSLRFQEKTTNLSALLSRVKSTFEGRNVTDVVLLSDGIVNQGASPTFGTYPFPIHALAVGDTTPKRDLNLKTVYANRVAYLGNQFPIQADVVATGFAGRAATVTLRQGGAVLAQQTVRFGQDETLVPVSLVATAKAKGLQHFVIDVSALPGEFSTRNNRKDVYLDVIDGKQKILIAAAAPHPDVKALKSILEKNENFEVDVQVLSPGVPPPATDKKYDLLVLHQLPDAANTSGGYLRGLLSSGTPVLFVLGNQSGTAALNGLQTAVQIQANPGQSDRVTGAFNATFNRVLFDAERLNLLRQLPPLTVPFGEYRLGANSEVVLYQRVGNTLTQKPLLVVNSGAKRTAVLLGEGLWQWRLEEFALTDKQDVVDELLLKLVQYVSAKDDKRKLRVYPLQNEYRLGETVTLETEIYNDIFERIYGPTVQLSLTSERGTRSYSYTVTEGNTRFSISDLPAGVYRYRATATVLGRAEVATGEFVVKDEQLEALNPTADFNLLRQLSQQTGGRFFTAGQFDNLRQYLLDRQVPNRLRSTEDLREPINLRWVFFILLVLLTAEWGLRKYYGGY
jgi:hypothetical protein